jgi:hypothetical protein
MNARNLGIIGQQERYLQLHPIQMSERSTHHLFEKGPGRSWTELIIDTQFD